MAAIRLGERRLVELFTRFGRARTLDAFTQLMDETEKVLRDRLRAVRQGSQARGTVIVWNGRTYEVQALGEWIGGAAGAGKTPVITLGDLEAMLWSFEPPYTQSQRAWIENIFLEAQFLEGDPDLHCRGVLVVKEDMHV